MPIVYKRLAEELGVYVTHEDCVEYGRSFGNWPAFEDSPGALQCLKRYFKLVILSNVDNETFQASNTTSIYGDRIGADERAFAARM